MKNLLLIIIALFTTVSCGVLKNEKTMKKVEVQQIRNATLKINYAGKTILVDPVLGSKNSFMSFVDPGKNLNPTVDLPVSINEVSEGVDFVLVTHGHPDHFDPKAIEVLNKELPIYTQPADVVSIKTNAFLNVNPVEDKVQIGNITLSRTDGVHGPEETLEILGSVSGFVLEADDYPTIYIVGDCIWNNTIENNIKKYNPDIIITNSGGAIFMGQSRILMDEKETVKVAKSAPNATIIAVHMEALDHYKTTRDMVNSIAKDEKVNIITPLDGETIEL